MFTILETWICQNVMSTNGFLLRVQALSALIFVIRPTDEALRVRMGRIVLQRGCAAAGVDQGRSGGRFAANDWACRSIGPSYFAVDV